ncbi:DNA polymerase III subunit alpha, partial [Streptomyces oryzae]|nr:DNA polymerase III subunit alpha [Streptomyces oryzae]
VAERLAQVGALDAFAPGGNRRDLLLHIAELHRAQRAAGAREGQLALGESAPADGGATDGTPHQAEPVHLPDLDSNERLGAELDVLGMDTSRHLMADHVAFLRELGAHSARTLRSARHGETVLIAGAKAATQTPPLASGKRVIFTTLDDGTGLSDLAFFEDSHAACAHTVFHSWLLLVRGVVQRRGPRSLTVVGSAAWNLAELVELRREGGLEAVTARLGEAPGSEPAAGPGRTIEVAPGYEMHPWADLRPAGETASSAKALRKMWHSSTGSAG